MTFFEEMLTQKPNETDWSIRDPTAHYFDTRVELMLGHDNPEITPLAVYEFATDEGWHPTTAHEILSVFEDKGTKCVDQLKALSLEDLWRHDQHPEFGQLTILRQTASLAYPEGSHLSKIEALFAQIGK